MAKKGEHHGGAWKVAYADFITALMALFMVLWISSQDEEILLATSGYFQNPFNSPMDQSMGVMSNSIDRGGVGKRDDEEVNNLIDLSFLHSLAREFYRLLDIDVSEDENPTKITVTSEGLMITVYNRSNQPLFVQDTDELTQWGGFVMQNIAWIVDRHDFGVSIEAHSASGFESIREDYGPWELTAGRANAVRRHLVHYALAEDKVERVIGFADTHPLENEPADSESNHRIEINLAVR